MAANRSNREVEGIDEAFLLQSIKEQDEPKETAKPASPPAAAGETRETTEPVPEKPKEGKEPARRKRNSNAGYMSLFLQRNEFKTRQCVYISQRVHATISEIVRVISDREITVGGYIDSILMEHLETHRDEIMELYNSELSKKNGKSLMEF
jgi:hypothetical protein